MELAERGVVVVLRISAVSRFCWAASLDQQQPETATASSVAQFAQFEVDAASRRVLTFVASAVHAAPYLLVATCRADELPRQDMAALARVGTTLAVPGRADDAAAELLRNDRPTWN